jgi:hypothetical protein
MTDAARCAALALSLLPSLAWGQPLPPEALPTGVLIAVDGRTRLRLEDVDAPESERDKAKCAHELRLGLAAKAAAQRLVAAGGIEIVYLRLPDGRLKRDRTQSRRPLVLVTVHGRPWLEAMREAGAPVRPWGERRGWCG